MNSLKVFIVVTACLLFLALALGVYVWYAVQQYERAIREPHKSDQETVNENKMPEIVVE
jgi:hypothetical protein